MGKRPGLVHFLKTKAFYSPIKFLSGPFATQPPGGGMAGLIASASKADSMRLQLSREEWFHGPISRKDSESLLKNVSGRC